MRFLFLQYDPKAVPRVFVFELTDPTRITEARSILATPSTLQYRVQGVILKKPAAYNAGWSFHLDPDSIGFFESAVEVCDANVTYVEAHLDEVGGSTLPNGFWCPWSSRLLVELPPP